MTCATYETDPETCATRYRAGRCKHCSAGLLASLDAQAAEMAPATPAPGMCPCGLPVRVGRSRADDLPCTAATRAASEPRTRGGDRDETPFDREM